MAEEPKDKLSELIRRKRKDAADAASGLAPAVSTEPLAATPTLIPAAPVPTEPASLKQPSSPVPSEPVASSNAVLASLVKKTIAENENPLALARALSALIEGGIRRQDVLAVSGLSKSWLSRKLTLLSAPPDVQALIASGELSESDYYENRHGVATGIKGRGETLRYKRMSRVSVYTETARDLALILQQLANQHGAVPVRVDAKTTSKDLTNLLNLRANEVWRLIKK